MRHRCGEGDQLPKRADRKLASRRNYWKSGGARRNRTADLFNAIEALSQLSYDPIPSRLRAGLSRPFGEADIKIKAEP